MWHAVHMLLYLHMHMLCMHMHIHMHMHMCLCTVATSRADLPSSCRSVPVKKAPCLPGAEGRPIGVASTAILESVTYKVL